jgi:hypothetical protein
MYAILAMDAYNRGYNPGLVYEGNSVGTATVTQQSETAANSPEVESSHDRAGETERQEGVDDSIGFSALGARVGRSGQKI